MASGREYLNSIITQCAALQGRTDAELADVADELHDADEAVSAAKDSLDGRDS